jgi:YbbR domain-containing protein
LKVPVILDNDFQLADDYFVLDTITIEPDSVVVWGPRQGLTGISYIKTEKLVINNLKNSQERTLRLVKPVDANLKLSVSNVKVFIPVEQFTEKSFQVAIFIRSSGDSVQLIPPRAKLSCVVPLSKFDQTTESDFLVEAVFPERTTKSKNNTAMLLVSRQPVWVRSTRIEPNSVEFLYIK